MSNNNYKVFDKTIIFNSSYNLPLDNTIIKIIEQCDKIYFCNCEDFEICNTKIRIFPDPDLQIYYGDDADPYKLSEFNYLIDNLPNSITYLLLGDGFNQPVDNLPNSIIHLEFGHRFNQPVDNFPISLKKLILGDSFNQPVDLLPNSIIHLEFGNSFNQPVDNLPNSIFHLEFGNSFNQPVDNLPNSICCLKFNGKDFKQEIKKFSENLKLIKIPIVYDKYSKIKWIIQKNKLNIKIERY
jgi:hypothetical protein